MIKSIVKNIFAQAENGIIKIGDGANVGVYKLKFYVNIEGSKKGKVDDKYLIVDIPNYQLFLDKVALYLDKATGFYRKDQQNSGLSDRAFKEKLFTFLMTNMSVFDAADVYNYIDTRTKMLENDLENPSFGLAEFSYEKAMTKRDVWVGGCITKNRSSLEGPYRLNMMCINMAGDQFNLPAITFGIVDDCAYVYAVQGGKTKQDGHLAKDLDRYFRKLNKGVDCEEIIANVSPNALAALTLFIGYLKKLGVKKIVAKDFLPLRYMAAIDTKIEKKEDLEIQEEKQNEIDRDQFNITNKFMYLFLRYNHHFSSNNAEYDDLKGEMNLVLQDQDEKKDDNLIYMLDKSVDKRGNIKRLILEEREI